MDAAEREAEAGRPPPAHLRRASGDADRGAGVLVGVVTRSDLLRPEASLGDRIRRRFRRADADEPLLRLARPRRTGPRPPEDAPVSSVMTTDVIAVQRSTALSRAAELMLHDRHHALPVVESDGRLVGLGERGRRAGRSALQAGPAPHGRCRDDQGADHRRHRRHGRRRPRPDRRARAAAAAGGEGAHPVGRRRAQRPRLTVSLASRHGESGVSAR